MANLIKSAQELQHPGFVLFEGMDLVGKSSLAKHTARQIESELGLNAQHNYNQGFIRPDIVDNEAFLKMPPREKSEYFTQCYLKDSLPSDPRTFREIIQDKHLPCIIYYALVRGGKRLDDFKQAIQECIKPKHVFLVECSYEERLKRAEKRDSLRTLEKLSLSSQETHDKLAAMYRKIIDAFEVPVKIIDTTTDSKEESIEKCLENLRQSKILTQDVTLNDLAVDFEPRVYESTVGLRMNEIQKGKEIKPVLIARRIDGTGRYVNILVNGRHRAYAAWKSGLKTIPGYVNYESVAGIDSAKLTQITEFTFKS